MLIECKKLAELTGAVCQAFEDYQASEVLQRVLAAKADLGAEYQTALMNHFNSAASGYFYCSLDNPACVNFLKEERHLQYLIWLLFSVENPFMDQETSNELYARNKEAIDRYLIDQFSKKLNRSQTDKTSSSDSVNEESSPTS